MADKNASYQEANRAFLEEVAQQPATRHLREGVMYQIIQKGSQHGVSPQLRNVVSVYYKGTLVNGKVFDDNTRQEHLDAFRLRDLIRGWQIALTHMKVGDKWRIFIPAEAGYGKIPTPGIPKHSTLIFEIQLVAIG